MTIRHLIPNIFYEDIAVGVDLFVHGLGFEIGYDDRQGEEPCCIVSRDSAKAFLHQSAEFAAKDRPELRIETDDIEGLYRHVMAECPRLLHPNGRAITLKPWGAREFALLDASGVCVIVMQWPE